MKIKLSLLLLAFFLIASCSKEKKDLRDQYAGRYDYTFNLTGQDDWGSYGDHGSGTIFVNKGQPNEMTFKDSALLYTVFMWENGNFTVPEDIIDVGGDAYKMTGEGQFMGDLLTLTLRMEATGFFDKSVIQISGDKR